MKTYEEVRDDLVARIVAEHPSLQPRQAWEMAVWILVYYTPPVVWEEIHPDDGRAEPYDRLHRLIRHRCRVFLSGVWLEESGYGTGTRAIRGRLATRLMNRIEGAAR
jgi:hypothetical protein